MSDNLAKLTEEAERARARLIQSGAEIRAKLSPAALTHEMESTVKAGASHLAATVKKDAQQHSGLIIGAIAALAAAAFLGRRQIFAHTAQPAHPNVRPQTAAPLRAQTDVLASAQTDGVAGFSLRTLFAALAPVAVGYFMGESTAGSRADKGFLNAALRSEPVRQIWRSQFGGFQHKLVNAYDLPKMAATLMLGLTVVSELTRSQKD